MLSARLAEARAARAKASAAAAASGGISAGGVSGNAGPAAAANDQGTADRGTKRPRSPRSPSPVVGSGSPEPPTRSQIASSYIVNRFLKSQIAGSYCYDVDSAVEQDPRPPDPDSYWAHVLRAATAHRWDRQFEVGLAANWGLDSGCSGVAGDFDACCQMHIPLDGCGSVSEPKQHAQLFLRHNRRNVIKRGWKSMGDQGAQHGRCFMSGNMVKQMLGARLRRIEHVLFLSPPCQPYSYYSGKTPANGCVGHPLFETLFGPEYLEKGMAQVDGDWALSLARRSGHRIIIVEEIVEFMNFDHKAGINPMKELVKSLMSFTDASGARRFSAWRHFIVGASKFADMARDRY